jgi:hypothetical protein
MLTTCTAKEHEHALSMVHPRCQLAAPVRIEGDGKVIDTVADIGHAGPQLRDLDGDGKPELLVSSFSGSIRVFANVGERSAPRFAEQQPLQAGGEPIRIHNW